MKKLRNVLFDSNVTQKELAAFCGCSQGYLSRCIRGRDVMSPRVLSLVAKFLGVSEEDITDDEKVV